MTLLLPTLTLIWLRVEIIISVFLPVRTTHGIESWVWSKHQHFSRVWADDAGSYAGWHFLGPVEWFVASLEADLQQTKQPYRAVATPDTLLSAGD